MLISKKFYSAAFLLIYASSIYGSQPETSINNGTEQQQIERAENTTNKGWFNFITAVRSFILDPIVKIKNYFFPPETVPVESPSNEIIPNKPLPEEAISARPMPPRISPISQPIINPPQVTTKPL